MLRTDEDFYVGGTLSAQAMVLPAGTVADAAVQPFAAIQASKLIHQRQPLYSQPSATTIAAAVIPLYLVYGATGTVLAFSVGSVVANVGGATVTVDLKIAGTSILTAPITLSSSNTAYQVVAATIATPALVAGRLLEVVVTVSVGGGTVAKGLFCSAILTETAQ